MENKIPQDILDKAKTYAEICINAHHKDMVIGGFVSGALSEREDMFGFMEWVENSPFMYNCKTKKYEFDIESATLQQLHEIYKRK